MWIQKSCEIDVGVKIIICLLVVLRIWRRFKKFWAQGRGQGRYRGGGRGWWGGDGDQRGKDGKRDADFEGDRGGGRSAWAL